MWARFGSDRLLDDRLIDDWIWCLKGDPDHLKVGLAKPARNPIDNRLLDDSLKDDQIRSTAKEENRFKDRRAK